MNYKESLGVYMKERECLEQCKKGCVMDCNKVNCKYFSTYEELKEAQKYAVIALQYCVNKGIEPVTRTEAVKAAKTLKEYCNQHNEDCENCVFVEGAFCNVKKMPFKYEEKEWCKDEKETGQNDERVCHDAGVLEDLARIF